MVLTLDSPRCCATSKTSLLPPLSHSKAVNISGSSPSNFTSTTAPITCVMFPFFAHNYKLSAPDIISINSFVIAA
jgi:hypothetical protein